VACCVRGGARGCLKSRSNSLSCEHFTFVQTSPSLPKILAAILESSPPEDSLGLHGAVMVRKQELWTLSMQEAHFRRYQRAARPSPSLNRITVHISHAPPRGVPRACIGNHYPLVATVDFERIEASAAWLPRCSSPCKARPDDTPEAVEWTSLQQDARPASFSLNRCMSSGPHGHQ
jgi:hypothetical protein